MRKIRVYLAAPWADKEIMKDIKKKFEAAGYEVTSRWIDLHVDKPQQPSEEGWAEATATVMHNEAYEDITDVMKADVFVLFNTQARGQETTGKAVETGWALANGLPVILVGGRTNVFHYMDEVMVVSTLEEALDVASKVRT